MNSPPYTGNADLDTFLYNLFNQVENTAAAVGNATGYVVDSDTGIISNNGTVVGYLYKYLHVKYADDTVGTNLSDSPVNRLYYGLRNTDTSVESTNPAEYTWYLASGGFSTNKELYYLVGGGRQIQFTVSLLAPSYKWVQDTGPAIDLDLIVPAVTVGTNELINDSVTNLKIAAAAITAAKTALAAIDPTSGNLSINSVTTNNLVAGAVTALKINVAQLSAITADLGTVTAGEIIIGSSPAISGTTMTGSGARIYSNGRFVLGNSTANITFNGTIATLNGFQVNATGSANAVGLFSGLASGYSTTITLGTFVCQSTNFQYGINLALFTVLLVGGVNRRLNTSAFVRFTDNSDLDVYLPTPTMQDDMAIPNCTAINPQSSLCFSGFRMPGLGTFTIGQTYKLKLTITGQISDYATTALVNEITAASADYSYHIHQLKI